VSRRWGEDTGMCTGYVSRVCVPASPGVFLPVPVCPVCVPAPPGVFLLVTGMCLDMT